MDELQAMKINAKLGGVNHVLHSVPFGWLKDAIVIGMINPPPAQSDCTFNVIDMSVVSWSCIKCHAQHTLEPVQAQM